MTFVELTTRTLAGIGAASVLYALYLKLRRLQGEDEDGPIRVKSGSVEISHDTLEWERDDSDGKAEYHYRGRQNGWSITVWKNNVQCLSEASARRVRLVIERDGPGNDGDIVFRANGAVRVTDEEGSFRIRAGNTLIDDNAQTDPRIKKVIVTRIDGTKAECEFRRNEKAAVELKPLRLAVRVARI